MTTDQASNSKDACRFHRREGEIHHVPRGSVEPQYFQTAHCQIRSGRAELGFGMKDMPFRKMIFPGHHSVRDGGRRAVTFQVSALWYIIFFLGWPLQAAEYFPPPDSDGGWRTLTNATQIRKLAGLDLRRLEQAY